MQRNLSLWLLLAMTAVIGVLLLIVIYPFIIALFVAMVLAVLFAPMNQYVTKRIGGRQRIAAAITTVSVLFLVLLPIGGTLIMAGSQLMESGKAVIRWIDEPSPEAIEARWHAIRASELGRRVDTVYHLLSAEQQEGLRTAAEQLAGGMTAGIYERTRSILSDMFTFALTLAVMVLSLYFFLADRELFLREVHRMLPLEDREEERLTARFQAVCRGVVLGTVVAGVVQAALAGIAYAVLGVPQMWLLIVLTMFFSFVPFLGAAAVWVLVVAYLIFQQRYVAAIGLLVYGVAIISTADNVVRAYVIGHEARMHPLVALVTVLGAFRLIGLWGIFVGPMLAGFFYALVNISQERVASTRADVGT